jgi:hypothetical protein
MLGIFLFYVDAPDFNIQFSLLLSPTYSLIGSFWNINADIEVVCLVFVCKVLKVEAVSLC